MRAIFVAVAWVVLGGVASADKVDDLVNEVTAGADYKDRLSAIGSLVDDGDPRAVAALISAVGNDSEKTVRAAAAIGLGKVVTAATPADLRQEALDALNAASSKQTEKDAFVRKQATKARDKLEDLGPHIYVELGPMASHVKSTSPSDADLTAAMQRTLETAVRRDAKDWLTSLPANATQIDAYYVDGAVEEILTNLKGGVTSLTCKVSLRIATYPNQSALATLSGGATVDMRSNADVAVVTYDCVDAVIEHLVVSDLIPAIDAGRFVTSVAPSKAATATTTAPVTVAADPAWSSDGWTLLGEDDVDLVDDEVEVNRRKSTWGEVAIVVTGDAVTLNTVELGLVGKGRKSQQAELGETVSADSSPQVIEVAGKRRAIDKVRLTYKKHTLDARTRVQVWAR